MPLTDDDRLADAKKKLRREVRLTRAKAKRERARRERGLSDPNDITTWDNEEIEEGRPRNDQGTFAGRPPKIPPRLFKQIRDEKYKRKLTVARDKLIAGQPDAADVVLEIARDEKAPYKDRLAAALALLDRGFGKAVQPVAVQAAVAVGVGFQGAPPTLSEGVPEWQSIVDQMLSMDVTEPESVVHSHAILGRKEGGQEPAAFGGYSGFGEPPSRVRVVDSPDDEADLLRMLHEHPQDPG